MSNPAQPSDLIAPSIASKLLTHHRRTQSSSVYDFKCMLNSSEPENINELIETHKVLSSNSTSIAVNASNLKQKEKQLIVENLDEVPPSRAIVPKSKLGNPINFVKKRNISLGSPTLSSCPVRRVELKTDYNSINALTGLNMILERKNSVESGCEIDTLDGKSDQKSISSPGTRTRTNSLGSPTFCERLEKKGINGLSVPSPKHSPHNSITLSIQQSESPNKAKTGQNWFSQQQNTKTSPSYDKFKKLTLDQNIIQKRISSHSKSQNNFLQPSPTCLDKQQQQQTVTSTYRIEGKTPLSAKNSKKSHEKKDANLTLFKEPLKSITPTGISSKKHFVFDFASKPNTNSSSLSNLHGKIITSKTTNQNESGTEKDSVELLSKLSWSYGPSLNKQSFETAQKGSNQTNYSNYVIQEGQKKPLVFETSKQQEITSPVKVDKEIERLQDQVQTLNGRTIELEDTVREFKMMIEKLMIQNKELANTTIEQSKAIKLLEEEISTREQARLVRNSSFLRANYEQGLSQNDNTQTMFLHSTDSSNTESPFTDGSINPNSERMHNPNLPMKGATSITPKEQYSSTSKNVFDSSKPVDKLIAQYKTALKKSGGRYNSKKLTGSKI